MIKAYILEALNKFIPEFNKSLEVFEYGDGNYYPELTQYLIEESVTAFSASNTLTQFIVGKGFGLDNEFIVNETKQLTLLDFAHKLGRSLSRNRGAYIQFNYNVISGEFVSVDVLPYSHGRVGKKDDDEYNGKIGLSNNWQTEKKPQEIDVYNRKVIQEQYKVQGENYKGQIWYINLDDYKYYANSTIHSVRADCESEIEASKYKNSSLVNGFFGKQFIVTKPFVDTLIDRETKLYAEQNSAREDFKKTMKEFIGGDSKRMLHLEMEFDSSEDIDKQLLIKEIESNIDDKIFEYTEKSVRSNILSAFYNLPELLVRNNDNAMFGNSGESIQQAKEFYQDNTTEIRMIFEKIINEVTKNFEGLTKEVEHELLIIKKEVVNETN